MVHGVRIPNSSLPGDRVQIGRAANPRLAHFRPPKLIYIVRRPPIRLATRPRLYQLLLNDAELTVANKDRTSSSRRHLSESCLDRADTYQTPCLARINVF